MEDTTTTEDWNPDDAGTEMEALFQQSDEIMKQPHYQDDQDDDD